MTQVTGDWTDQVYEAAELGPFWNGMATPRFARAEAERVVRDQGKIEGAEVRLAWVEGEDAIAVMWEAGFMDVDAVTHIIRPDAEGLYDLSLGWAWVEIDLEEEGSLDATTAAILAQVEDVEQDVALEALRVATVTTLARDLTPPTVVTLSLTEAEMRLLWLGAETLREANPDDLAAQSIDLKVAAALRLFG